MKIRKITAAALAVITAAGAAASVSAKSFTDINDSHWAYGYIDALADWGIISGYEDGSFRAEEHITRAQWASMFAAAGNLQSLYTGLALDCCADMTTDHWAANAMVAVKDYLTPYWDTSIEGWWYYPEREATREDVVVSLAKYKEYGTDNTTVLDSFTDSASISAETKPYAAAAVENGLVSGFEDGTLRLSSPVTRAEASVFICRAFGIEPKTQPSGRYAALSKLPYGGNVKKCVMSADMAASYADVLDSLPKTFSKDNRTYNLKAYLADPADDGMPLLITAYADDKITAYDKEFKIDVWTWDGKSASVLPYRDKAVCGASDIYFIGSDMVIPHGPTQTIGSRGTVIYTVSNANVTLKHEYLYCYAASGDGVTASAAVMVSPDGQIIKNSNSDKVTARVSDLTSNGWKNESGGYVAQLADGKRVNSSDDVPWLPSDSDSTMHLFGYGAGTLELVNADKIGWSDADDVAALLRLYAE